MEQKQTITLVVKNHPGVLLRILPAGGSTSTA